MNFEHSFFVPLPVDRAWTLFQDIERIAPCVPGAQLEEAHGDDYRGVVKVRLGPITAQYRGVVTIGQRDQMAHRMVMDAKARDVHGQGNANARIVALMTPEAAGTRIVLSTELQISGKVAQLGKGVMQDVSGKLIQQFAQALEREITSPAGAGATGVAKADAQEVEPVDLLALSGSAVAKRIGMALAVALAGVAIFTGWRRLTGRKG